MSGNRVTEGGYVSGCNGNSSTRLGNDVGHGRDPVQKRIQGHVSLTDAQKMGYMVIRDPENWDLYHVSHQGILLLKTPADYWTNLYAGCRDTQYLADVPTKNGGRISIDLFDVD